MPAKTFARQLSVWFYRLMRRRLRIFYKAIMFCILAGTAFPQFVAAQNNSREIEARRLFVEAERLVRQSPCGTFSSMSILFAWGLDLEKAREQLGCLGKKAKAAILYDRLLTEYQETEAAFAAAQTPALSQADIALFRQVLESRITELEQPAKSSASNATPKASSSFNRAERTEMQRLIDSRSIAPISLAKIEDVRRQIEACWNLPAGARDAGGMTVEIRTLMNPDGRVRSASIIGSERTSNDRFYRTMAESALRAVLNPRCQPLRLPLEKYDEWRVMVFSFDPQQMN